MAWPPVADHLAFAFGAALLFGFGPILAKRGLAGGGDWMGNTLTVLGVRTVLFWVGLGVVSGGTDPFAGVTPAAVAIFALAGVSASGLGRVFLYAGVDRVGSSLSTAVANTRPLFSVLLAVAWLGESVTFPMAVGVALLVAGLVVLSLSRGGDVRGWKRKELVIPLIAAVTWAVGNVGRRFGFTVTPLSAFQALAIGEPAALGVLVGYAAATGRLGSIRAPRKVHALFIGSGLFAGVGLFLLFEALRRGPVSVVDPVIATSPLFTVVLAAVLLRDFERITPGVVAGSLVIVVGAVMVT